MGDSYHVDCDECDYYTETRWLIVVLWRFVRHLNRCPGDSNA